MPGVCVTYVATPVGDATVFGFDRYPLAEGQPCPADGFVIFDATTAQQLESSSSPDLPSPEQAAAAWGASFVLVVGCYALGRAIGAVVNFLK